VSEDEAAGGGETNSSGQATAFILPLVVALSLLAFLLFFVAARRKGRRDDKEKPYDVEASLANELVGQIESAVNPSLARAGGMTLGPASPSFSTTDLDEDYGEPVNVYPLAGTAEAEYSKAQDTADETLYTMAGVAEVADEGYELAHGEDGDSDSETGEGANGEDNVYTLADGGANDEGNTYAMADGGAPILQLEGTYEFASTTGAPIDFGLESTTSTDGAPRPGRECATYQTASALAADSEDATYTCASAFESKVDAVCDTGNDGEATYETAMATDDAIYDIGENEHGGNTASSSDDSTYDTGAAVGSMASASSVEDAVYDIGTAVGAAPPVVADVSDEYYETIGAADSDDSDSELPELPEQTYAVGASTDPTEATYDVGALGASSTDDAIDAVYTLGESADLYTDTAPIPPPGSPRMVRVGSAGNAASDQSATDQAIAILADAMFSFGDTDTWTDTAKGATRHTASIKFLNDVLDSEPGTA
jgi:hypothetical protein